MPEDSKKATTKSNKNDVKEQRKPRRQNQPTACDKKTEKKVEELKNKVTIPKPATVEPGPEFYKNLKRETDEILKITEEANLKFKKKEIQSNWAKYETPIESYDDIEEQENLGADYEKLIQTPMSIGGHFQFKHEKSWDVTSGPSLYDKYFEIDTVNLANALNCIPFCERNGLDPSMFTDGDKMSMEHRASRYKRKYFNDNSQDTIESKILEGLKKPEVMTNFESQSEVNDINLEGLSLNQATVPTEEIIDETQENNFPSESNFLKEPKDIISNDKIEKEDEGETVDFLTAEVTSLDINKDDPQIPYVSTKPKSTGAELIGKKQDMNVGPNKSAKPPAKAKPIGESPEDLEKWLDDFLDG